MITKKGDIKLIDYEGIVHKDSTVVMVTALLRYSQSLVADETLRSMYCDYVKFFGVIVEVLYYLHYGDKSDLEKDLKLLQDKFVEHDNNNRNRVDKAELCSSGRELLKTFKSFHTKYSQYFKNNNLKFSEDQFNNVEKLINIQIDLLEKEEYKDGTDNIKVFYGDITDKILNSKLKEKNSIYIINDSMVINKSNKLVSSFNGKFIEKREKGDFLYCIPWYNVKTNRISYEPLLLNFRNSIQNIGTVFQEIVDDLIPIDETSIFQQLVLGTLIKKFIDANPKNNKKTDEEYFEELYQKLTVEKNREIYFGKEAFKKVFMKMIEI
ncbi:hypothetical protein, partial [Candidatus Ruminimicrobium bovinum]|uniref:hypothetical protein n=1 Tax=Candidatus Ruminimicrobium bovinum TaxID=3242779 RepID=UPI0039B8A4A4